MLQLKLVDTFAHEHPVDGAPLLQRCYEGANVLIGRVCITHNDRSATNLSDSNFVVEIFEPIAYAPNKVNVCSTMKDAKRWAETQVSMSFYIGEEA